MMEDLTQQMLNDYRRYIDPAKWDNFERRRLEDVNRRGEIVNILDIWSADGTELLERVYQREYQIGTDGGITLNCAAAGVENLNALIWGDDDTFAIVKTAIDKGDPIKLLSLSPDDEYDLESRHIASKITKDSSIDEITQACTVVFTKWFSLSVDKDKTIFAEEKFIAIAQEIHDGLSVIENKKTGDFMAKRWFKNLSHLSIHGNPGNCPSCRSSDTDYTHVLCEGDNIFLEMWCNACGRGEQVCGRGTPPEGYKVISADEYTAWKRNREV
jgi:hypothetical protein